MSTGDNLAGRGGEHRILRAMLPLGIVFLAFSVVLLIAALSGREDVSQWWFMAAVNLVLAASLTVAGYRYRVTHEDSTWISDGIRIRRDPESYAIVRELAIVLVHTAEFGTQMRWQRPTGEVLVEFPWWDHLESDANRWPVSWPPIGTLDTPLFDADQGWWFSAWEDGGFVFVETGTDLVVATASFRVAVSDFMAAWADGVRSLPRK